MTVALLLITFALVGYIGGRLHEIGRPGGTDDLVRQLAEARLQIGRANLHAVVGRGWTA